MYGKSEKRVRFSSSLNDSYDRDLSSSRTDGNSSILCKSTSSSWRNVALSNSKALLRDLLSNVTGKTRSRHEEGHPDPESKFFGCVVDEKDQQTLSKLQKSYFTEEEKRYNEVVGHLRRAFSKSSIFDVKDSSKNTGCHTVSLLPIPSPALSSSWISESTVGDYESVTSFIEEDPEVLQRRSDLFVQQDICKQLQSYLTYGINQLTDFVGSRAHLEAERLYVLTSKLSNTGKTPCQFTKTRFLSTESKIMMLEAPVKYSPDRSDSKVTELRITDIRVFINTQDHPLRQSYMLVLRHHETVYATRLAKPNPMGWVIFGGPFIYRKCSAAFDIEVVLYRLGVNSTTSKHFSGCFGGATPDNGQTSMIRFLGDMSIELENVANKSFMFRHSDKSFPAPDVLLASIIVKRQYTESDSSEAEYIRLPDNKSHTKSTQTSFKITPFPSSETLISTYDTSPEDIVPENTKSTQTSNNMVQQLSPWVNTTFPNVYGASTSVNQLAEGKPLVDRRKNHHKNYGTFPLSKLAPEAEFFR
ncbi:hypothetical protein GWI33_017584 [Rhynchophorus ferrugineus]|uniref:Uncharacterized protein n=1 Tax=Rhynchophorus ferrugineus TaxID=354439 RepID=A0A834M2A8_RHYFE|nr:hypothetical protein GWI33_017584 [Rhynchophorus ferrugineus]